MSFMVVTLDVFQLETSALKLSKPLNSPFMLSMDETSHLSMAPYMAMVEEALKSNARTAFFREAVLVKVPGGCGGGEGGDGGDDGGVGGGGGNGGDEGGGGCGSGEGDEGGEGGCEGGVGGAGGAGGGGGGKQSSQPARLVNPSVIHWIGVPSGTTPSGESVP